MTWRTSSEKICTALLVLCLFVAAKPAEASVSGGGKLDCEAEFVKVMEDSRYIDLGNKIKRWKALAPQCAGTGIYESRLGTFYTQAKKYDAARKILNQGVAHKTGYEKELRLGLFAAQFRQEKPQELQELAAQAISLVKDFPEWAGGYGALAEVRLAQHRFQEGIDNLEHANSLTPNSGAYVLLAMAYYKVDRPRDSAIAMQKALKLDKEALKHTQAVCATAYSLVAMGELAAADDLLVKHLKVQPAASNDPTYQKTSTFVVKKIQESQSEKKQVF